MIWRTPVLAGMRLPVALKLPDGVRNVEEPSVQELPDSLLERRSVDAGPAGLAGKRIEFPGLQLTITDVLVRVQLLDGRHSTTLVRPSQPWVEIPRRPAARSPSRARFSGRASSTSSVGYDHLLFVLRADPDRAQHADAGEGRSLPSRSPTRSRSRSPRLGVAHVPATTGRGRHRVLHPAARERDRALRRGESSVTARWPWVVAFCFGLLHGFGFAGALSEIGLPRGDIPLALFAFNVGVELGQLAFIGAVLGALTIARRFGIPALVERHVTGATPYVIGALAGFWFVGRVATFWG